MEIPLAADLVPLVLSGKKTSTVRLGIRNYLIGPATIVSGDRAIPIEITEIQFAKVGQLNEAIAKAEGYNSLEELLNALKRFYPNAQRDCDVTVVHFRRS